MVLKNVVTISLMIFIIAIVAVLAGALLTKPQTETIMPTNLPSTNTNPVVVKPTPVVTVTYSQEENEDEEDDNSVPPAPNPTPTPTPTPAPAPAPSPGISSATVAQHNTASNCWFIIGSGVYNVTSYIPIHPGGPGQIIPFCGKDATNAFNTMNGKGSHSSSAQNMLINYYVGSFAG